jgi:hypothetical protein
MRGRTMSGDDSFTPGIISCLPRNNLARGRPGYLKNLDYLDSEWGPLRLNLSGEGGVSDCCLYRRSVFNYCARWRRDFREFIAGLIKIVRRKLRHVLPAAGVNNLGWTRARVVSGGDNSGQQ